MKLLNIDYKAIDLRFKYSLKLIYQPYAKNKAMALQKSHAWASGHSS